MSSSEKQTDDKHLFIEITEWQWERDWLERRHVMIMVATLDYCYRDVTTSEFIQFFYLLLVNIQSPPHDPAGVASFNTAIRSILCVSPYHLLTVSTSFMIRLFWLVSCATRYLTCCADSYIVDGKLKFWLLQSTYDGSNRNDRLCTMKLS